MYPIQISAYKIAECQSLPFRGVERTLTKRGKYKKLCEWASELGIPASTFRAEFLAGYLKGIRARPSSNAPILVSEVEMDRWLNEVAGQRKIALSPSEASAVNKSVARHA